MRKSGVVEKYVRIVQDMYEDSVTERKTNSTKTGTEKVNLLCGMRSHKEALSLRREFGHFNSTQLMQSGSVMLAQLYIFSLKNQMERVLVVMTCLSLVQTCGR